MWSSVVQRIVGQNNQKSTLACILQNANAIGQRGIFGILHLTYHVLGQTKYFAGMLKGMEVWVLGHTVALTHSGHQTLLPCQQNIFLMRWLDTGLCVAQQLSGEMEKGKKLPPTTCPPLPQPPDKRSRPLQSKLAGPQTFCNNPLNTEYQGQLVG